MVTANSRQLPCGHCIHDECLERWVGEQPNCPVCQYNLTVLLRPVEKAPTKPEAEVEPVAAEKEVVLQQPEEQIRQRMIAIIEKLRQYREEAEMIAGELDALEG
jgi:uncharacterized Zn finger protein (UPF0148 family)